MKLVKSLLLGSAAGIAAVAGAQAADLPSRKAAPVEYVRVCTAYGAGFFYIPGTDTCLRVGGRVRAEYTFGERWSRAQDSYGTRARGRIYIDARTATAYGTLRTFVRYDVTTQSGGYNYGGPNAGTNRFNSATGGVSDSGLFLDKAFVQFGPITAGKAQSFFDFYANDFGFSVVRTSDRYPNLLAYTATFGSGFSATISLEDGLTTGRRPFAAVAPFSAAYEGQTYPDVVASLRVDQGWGSAQLSGAVGNRGTFNVLNGASNDDVGYAIQGGVKINLPMLAAGDTLFLQAGYADAAIEYLGWNGSGNSGFGRVATFSPNNAYVDPISGQVDTATAWNVVAAFRHFWMPTLRSDFIGSYSEVKAVGTGVIGATVAGAPIFGAAKLDPKELIVGANLVWMPVSGLDIGVEVLYSRMEFKNRIQDAKQAFLGGPIRTIKSDDAFTGRLRIQRDF
ncbi:porin [Bosea sp. BH3]|uniref:porin n=1 Tax=Bosea sp. BH3 TaxID=2871701 RepID=UPI0021CB7C28|nr:porin [Bosea sp. BH3]MCU4181960.1 porin [Bosea sp. BH3]